MKKTIEQKKFIKKKSELEALKFFANNKFVSVNYADIQLVPLQAKLLGFIRGMILSNQKKPKMHIRNEIWMKETVQKMAFLLGYGESTLKEHIKTLISKGYLKQGNFSNYHDNTNWYCIDESKIKLDFNNYMNELENEFKLLYDNMKMDHNLALSDNLTDDNCIEEGQKLTYIPSGSDQTLLYNNIKIPLRTSYNILESVNNESDVNSDISIDIETNLIQNESIEEKKLEKKYCFNKLNEIFPNGWYESLNQIGGEKTLLKFIDSVENYSKNEIQIISSYMLRMLE
jgi:hypothetical protein